MSWAGVRDAQLREIEILRRNATAVFEQLVLPRFQDATADHHDQTLYGFVHRVFALVDLLSAYWWIPTAKPRRGDQSRRMIAFLTHYAGGDRLLWSVAVQIWRHQLFHTARPRRLHERTTGRSYYWLLQWGDPHLERSQHRTFVDDGQKTDILQLGLLHLIDDLAAAAAKYFADVAADPARQRQLEAVEHQLANEDLQTY